MTQIDEKLIELIHAGIDDELSDAERVQLQEQLEENPDARALQRDMQQLAKSLEPLGDLIPPAHIRENILDAAVPTASSITLRLIAALLPSTAIPRYALAFVGGLLFGFTALQLGEGYRSEMDPAQFVGTMTDYSSLPHAVTADDINLDLEQIKGLVRLHQIGSMLVIEFKLDSPEAVTVVTEYGGMPVDFKGFSLLENELASFVADNVGISLVASGSHRYSIFLQQQRPGDTSINLRFSADGETFHLDTLKSPAVE